MLKMKPLLDEMYSEMRGLYEEVERYKRELEGYKSELEGYKKEVERYKSELEGRRIVDSSYESSATAAPRSEVGVTRRISCESESNVVRSVEACAVKEENITDDEVFNFGRDTVKNVVISENEQKCADRKEYYRVYRLKQKALKASKNK
jgi:hypothetical protein